MKHDRFVADIMVFGLCIIICIFCFTSLNQLPPAQFVAPFWYQVVCATTKIALSVGFAFSVVFCIVFILHLDSIISQIKKHPPKDND